MNQCIDKRAVGQRIHAIRMFFGYSMSDFINKIDGYKHRPKVPGIVSRWESGLNLPNKDRLYRISELSGYTINEILHGNPEKELPVAKIHANGTVQTPFSGDSFKTDDCEYCHPPFRPLPYGPNYSNYELRLSSRDSRSAYLVIDTSVLDQHADFDNFPSSPIKFCPICGRHLDDND